MTTTPFYLGEVDYPGSDPGEAQPWGTGLSRIYLGKPDQQMVELPSPNSYMATPSQGEVEFGTANGGSSGTMNASTMRRYTLGWNRIIGRDWNVIDGFKRRHIFGPIANSKGPWAFVPPEDTNRLTRAQSLCGALNGVVEGWVNATVPTYQDDVAPAIGPGGVMRWAPTAGQQLSATLDPLRSPPYLPAESCGFLFYAFTVSGTAQMAASLVGKDGAGTITSTAVQGSTVTVGTDPAPVYVLIDPLELGSSPYVIPQIVNVNGVAVLLSNPVFWYGEDIPDWAVGVGVPRVIWPVGMGDLPVEPTGTRPAQMVLAETVDGAA